MKETLTESTVMTTETDPCTTDNLTPEHPTFVGSIAVTFGTHQ